MSDRALAYSTEPLRHRHLVIYEAAGMASEFATYLIRSLLSEGRIEYQTVEKTTSGLAPKVVQREGPTGLIVTTTSERLHPENETRLLSLTVSDTQEQTKAIFKASAIPPGEVEVTEWKALQIWLATGQTSVVVPFAAELADLIAGRRAAQARLHDHPYVGQGARSSAPSVPTEGRCRACHCNGRGLCGDPRAGKRLGGRRRGRDGSFGDPRDRRRSYRARGQWAI